MSNFIFIKQNNNLTMHVINSLKQCGGLGHFKIVNVNTLPQGSLPKAVRTFPCITFQKTIVQGEQNIVKWIKNVKPMFYNSALKKQKQQQQQNQYARDNGQMGQMDMRNNGQFAQSTSRRDGPSADDRYEQALRERGLNQAGGGNNRGMGAGFQGGMGGQQQGQWGGQQQGMRGQPQGQQQGQWGGQQQGMGGYMDQMKGQQGMGRQDGSVGAMSYNANMGGGGQRGAAPTFAASQGNYGNVNKAFAERQGQQGFQIERSDRDIDFTKEGPQGVRYNNGSMAAGRGNSTVQAQSYSVMNCATGGSVWNDNNISGKMKTETGMDYDLQAAATGEDYSLNSLESLYN